MLSRVSHLRPLTRALPRFSPALSRGISYKTNAELAAEQVKAEEEKAKNDANMSVGFYLKNFDYTFGLNAPITQKEADSIGGQFAGLVIFGGIVSAVAYLLNVYEPAHKEHEPHYNVPYAYQKRSMEKGAGWWPGQHCQFFEMNCFRQVYAEADQLLAQVEAEERAGKR